MRGRHYFGLNEWKQLIQIASINRGARAGLTVGVVSVIHIEVGEVMGFSIAVKLTGGDLEDTTCGKLRMDAESIDVMHPSSRGMRN